MYTNTYTEHTCMHTTYTYTRHKYTHVHTQSIYTYIYICTHIHTYGFIVTSVDKSGDSYNHREEHTCTCNGKHTCRRTIMHVSKHRSRTHIHAYTHVENLLCMYLNPLFEKLSCIYTNTHEEHTHVYIHNTEESAHIHTYSER